MMWKYTPWPLKANISKMIHFPGLFQVGVQTRNCTVFGQGVVLLTERMHTLMSNIIMLLHQMKNVCSDIAKCTTIYFTVDFILSVCMCICMVEWITYVRCASCHSKEVKGQIMELAFFLLPPLYRFLGLKWSCQALWQTPLPMEPPCWPLI